MPDDFRVSAGFFDHPKTKKLEYRAGEVATLCFLRLWRFCAVTPGRCSGDLGGMDAEDVEIASGWKGETGALVGALEGVGYLDGSEGGWVIHEFDEHQPWVSSGSRRSVSAKRASMIRWHKNGRHAGAPANGCPMCFPQCAPDAGASKTDAGAYAEPCGSHEKPSPGSGSHSGSHSDPQTHKGARVSGSRIKPVDLRAKAPIASIVAVFEYWRDTYHPDQFPTPHAGLREWKQIEERIQKDSCTVDQLKKAIDGIHKDTWEGRPRNLTLHHAIKDLSAVQRFTLIADGDNGSSPGQPTEAQREAWRKQEEEDDARIDAIIAAEAKEDCPL